MQRPDLGGKLLWLRCVQGLEGQGAYLRTSGPQNERLAAILEVFFRLCSASNWAGLDDLFFTVDAAKIDVIDHPPAQARGPQVENMKTVSTLRSGNITTNPHSHRSTLNEDKENEIELETKEEVEENVEKSKGKEKITKEPLDKIKMNEDPNYYIPRVPFPEALKPKSKNKLTGNEELMEESCVEEAVDQPCALGFEGEEGQLSSMFQNNDLSFPLECSPKVELKPLPANLKYIFLGENETWPIIIASDLDEGQEKKLIEVLKIHRKTFQVHDKVWLFNSRLRVFSRKLKSRWDGPYIVVKTCDNGAIMILDPKTGQSFTVKGQRNPVWKLHEGAGSCCAGA
ncbi:hypothetical protein Taro_015091 [Colocasia esculenta]|uniref:Uncharacterized protein n=1 Tax=Colocasia esculenta TaxID=4460 RepID=A0A843UGV2_COLES|nr:hypothetical protein [Colocasia esculenta]